MARYWPDRDDLAELRHGVEAVARIYLAAGAERVLLPCADAPAVRFEAELHGALEVATPVPHRFSLNSVHPQGSCPLGSDPGRCAVDPHGEIWGEAGVFVSTRRSSPPRSACRHR